MHKSLKMFEMFFLLLYKLQFFYTIRFNIELLFK